MKTIFGEENFIDKEMINVYKLYDEQLTDGIYACATKMGIQIDKQKFEHWLNFCAKLEQIDRSDLIDIAIKRKFDEKDYKIAVLERALELACEPRDDWNGKRIFDAYTNYYDYFLRQAEKELGNGNLD